VGDRMIGNAREHDEEPGGSVVLQAPRGTEYLTVLDVCYERISVEPFRERPGSEASAKGLTRRRQSS
jgi:transcription elongation factor GreB